MYGFNSVGKHILVDMYGLNDIFQNMSEIQKILIAAVENADFTVLSVQQKEFEPCGITVLILLAESHVSIHTWPEDDYAAMDIFTCGPKNPDSVMKEIIGELKPKWIEAKYISRGKKSS